MGRVRGAVAVSVALVLGLAAVGLLGFSSTLNPIDAILGRGAIVDVPDVVDDPQPRAVAEVTAAGLEVQLADAFSLSAPRGTIIAQTPAGGERVREGTTVELVVSKGANRVEMPDAVGRPFDEVAAPFREADIALDVERVPSERIPDGIVIEQSPGPGIVVTGLDPVSFVVSDGAADRPVPEVVGRSLDAAGFELGRAGLTLGEVTEVDDPAVPAGAVISTDPAPGAVVPIERPVAVVVSLGPALAPVPEVVETSEATARNVLQREGYLVAVASRLLGPDDSGLGAVFEQFPEAGTPLRRGQTVTIVVGRNPPPLPPQVSATTTTTTTTTTTVPRR